MGHSDSYQLYLFHCELRGDRAPGVSVIDPTTAAVVRTASFDGAATFPGDPAVHPDGRHLYVPDVGGIRVVDAENLVQTTALEVRARYVSVSPDGGKLFATSGNQNDGVLEIDSATGGVLRALAEFGAGFADSVSSGDGRLLYVGSAHEQPRVWALDLAGGELGEPVDIGAALGVGAPIGRVRLALAADDRTLYAWHNAAGRLVAIDTATFTVIARREWIGDAIVVDDHGELRAVVTGAAPVDVALDADGRQLVAAFGSGPGVVLDPATLVDRHELPVCGTASWTRVCVGPDGTVCASEGDTIAVIAPAGLPDDRHEVTVPGLASRAVVVPR